MHVHGFQYRILDRKGSPEKQRPNSVHDTGSWPANLDWKDRLLVWRGEKALLAIDLSLNFWAIRST